MIKRTWARRAASISVAAGALVAAGLATTASAAPGHRLAADPAVRAPARPVVRAAADTDPAAATDPLTAQLAPGEVLGFLAPVGLATSIRDTRAKVDAFIPAVTAIAFVGTSTRPPLSTATGYTAVPKGLLPARPDPACDYYVNDLNNNLYTVKVGEKDGKQVIESAGAFPPAHVSMLAFGALPITATLTAHQLVRDGKIVPIQANQVSNGASVRKDDPAGVDSSNTGCDRDWERHLPSVTISTGQVTATFTDVRVDGRPVDVGDDCHTARPLDLHLIGEDAAHGGTYLNVQDGGALVQARNTSTTNPGNPIALFPDSENLTIPPFVGCRGASGEDVSSLITRMISGPDNTLVVNQTKVLFNFFDPANPSLCNAPDDCLVDPVNLNPPAPGK